MDTECSIHLALDSLTMEHTPPTHQPPARFPLWVIAVTVSLSALMTIYGAIRAFYYQSSFLSPIAYTTDERPTAERLSLLLETTPDRLLVGIHTFFDFLVSYYWGTLSNPWLEGGEILPVNYPPLAMAFMEIWAAFPYKTALAIYLPLMALALIAPVWIALRRTRWSLQLLAVGVVLLSGPAIASLDRGNTQGFIPILLFAFGVLALKGRWGWASVFLVLATSLKIFPALLLFVLIAERKWRTFFGSVGALAAIHTLGFLPYPGSAPASFEAWFTAAFGWLGRDSLAGFLEYNASFVGGLAHWAMFLGFAPVASFLAEYGSIIAILVTGFTIFFIFLRTRLSLTVRLFAAFMTSTIVLPVAYPYTANWVIAALALLFLGAAPALRETDLAGHLERLRSAPRESTQLLWVCLALASGLLLTFAPVFIPGTMESGYRAGVASLLMPIAVVIALVGMSYAAAKAKPAEINSTPGPSTAAVAP